MQIQIIVRHGCPYCTMAEAFLNERKLPFDKQSIDDWDDRQAFYDRLGLKDADRTVPQIIIDGTRIGGYGDLVRSPLFIEGDVK